MMSEKEGAASRLSDVSRGSATGMSPSPIDRLLAIMARLRDPVTGCEWDSVQTFATIAPYTIEEAYEVADAIARGDMVELKDELGDLLLQVVFHARMAEEQGSFDFHDVVTAISDKMERRHPHLFGRAAEGGHHLWEQIKAEERAAKADDSALAGIALALPALKRAEKIQKRAARVGFDWPDISGPRGKIDEELAEIAQAGNDAERAAEIGDLLFSVVNYARHLGVDPEAALSAAGARFERRFRKMEEISDKPMKDMNLDQLESLWKVAKARA
jgi:ATP diphosphatase